MQRANTPAIRDKEQPLRLLLSLLFFILTLGYLGAFTEGGELLVFSMLCMGYGLLGLESCFFVILTGILATASLVVSITKAPELLPLILKLGIFSTFIYFGTSNNLWIFVFDKIQGILTIFQAIIRNRYVPLIFQRENTPENHSHPTFYKIPKVVNWFRNRIPKELSHWLSDYINECQKKVKKRWGQNIMSQLVFNLLIYQFMSSIAWGLLIEKSQKMIGSHKKI